MKTLGILILSIFTAISTHVAMATEPLVVTAADLLGKVYGVVDPHQMSRTVCRNIAAENYSATPVEDEGAEWLTPDEGFSVSYRGQLVPEAEAMARYDADGCLAGYGYVFYFPYEATCREKANGEQCAFCSLLLQELTDMGVILGVNPMTDALFDVGGIYEGNDMQLTLRESVESETVTPELQAGAIPADRSGEFVLLMSIVPARTLDYTAALIP